MITLVQTTGIVAGSFGSVTRGTHARSEYYTSGASGGATYEGGAGGETDYYTSSALKETNADWAGITCKTVSGYAASGSSTGSGSGSAGTVTITNTEVKSYSNSGGGISSMETVSATTENSYITRASDSASGASASTATGNDGDTANTTLQSTTTATASASTPSGTLSSATQFVETLTGTATYRNPATAVRTATYPSFGTVATTGEVGVVTTQTSSTPSSVSGSSTTQSSSWWETVYSSAAAAITLMADAITRSDGDSSYVSGATAAESAPFTVTHSNGLMKVDSTFYPKGEGTRQMDTGIWLWKARATGGLDSSIARFGELFESSTGDSIVVGDFRRSRMQSRALQVLAYSKATGATTLTARSYDSDGAYAGTTSYAASTETVWINGAQTSMSATALGASQSHTSGAAETFETTEQVAATVADTEVFTGGSHVGSSLSTWTYLSWTKTMTASSAVWTHPVMESYYTSVSGGVSNQWSTSSSEATAAGLRTNFTVARPSWFDWSGTEESTINRLRKHTETILISSYSRTGTGSIDADVLLGYKTTTSERLETYTTSTTAKHRGHTVLQSVYGLQLGDTGNSEVTESSSVSENVALTAWQGDACGPTWAAQTAYEARGMFRALPFAYVGFGGTFQPESLSPYLSTSSALVAGSDFGGALKMQIGTHLLPGFASASRSAYPGATYYPVISGESPVLATTSSTVSFSGFPSMSYSAVDSLLQRAEAVTTYASSTSAIQVAATWTSTYTSLTGTTAQTLTSSRLATYEIGLSGALSGEWHDWLTLDAGAAGGGAGVGSTGGFALGHNALPGASYTLFFGCGFVQWREYASTDAAGTAGYTGGSLHSTSDTIGSVSITVPYSHAIVYTAEPLFSAGWAPAYPASVALPISKFYPDPAS